MQVMRTPTDEAEILRLSVRVGVEADTEELSFRRRAGAPYRLSKKGKRRTGRPRNEKQDRGHSFTDWKVYQPRPRHHRRALPDSAAPSSNFWCWSRLHNYCLGREPSRPAAFVSA
jgi:hypothetical protein